MTDSQVASIGTLVDVNATEAQMGSIATLVDMNNTEAQIASIGVMVDAYVGVDVRVNFKFGKHLLHGSVIK